MITTRKIIQTILVAFIAFLATLGLSHIGCFIVIENQQWLKSPDVYYDWWHFLFFWDNAYAWLWFHNWTSWLLITCIYATVTTIIVATLFLST